MLRLRSFAYDSAYPYELSNKPSELSSEPLSEPTGLLVLIACRIAMIAVKNGIITTVAAAMMIDQKARGPDNFITTDQTLCLKISTFLHMNI